MNESLFHPKLGYYQKQNPFGSDGDFITAPEISQVFGELIGAYFVNLWQNRYNGKKIHLVEMGAGKGTLMKDLLNFAQKIPNFLENINISIVEISQRLQKIQKHKLQGFKIDWYDNFTDFYAQNNEAPILFLANELFDCFAIDQFIKTENGWAEKMIGIGDNEELQFVLQPSLAPLKIMPNYAKIGDVFEYSSSSINFMTELASAIKTTNGIGLIIDYGHIGGELKNTLQAIRNHKHCDVLYEAGNSDITTLVDFSALQKISQKNNLQTSIVTQKEFLNSLGIEARREKLLTKKTLDQQEEINSAINRLLDEKQMGELFKVLIIW